MHLDVVDLGACASVCKSWSKLANDEQVFVNSILTLTIFIKLYKNMCEIRGIHNLKPKCKSWKWTLQCFEVRTSSTCIAVSACWIFTIGEIRWESKEWVGNLWVAWQAPIHWWMEEWDASWIWHTNVVLNLFNAYIIVCTGTTDPNMRVNGSKTKNKAKEPWHGLTANLTRVLPNHCQVYSCICRRMDEQ